MCNESLFLNRIVEKESILPKIAEDLRSSDLPIVLYGAGDTAKLLYTLLTELGVKIDAVAVSEKYFVKDQFFYEHKVYSLKEALIKYRKCNVIPAFLIRPSFGNIEKRLLDTGCVESVFSIDCIFEAMYLAGDNIDYNFVYDNRSAFSNLYDMLADSKSKDTMAAFLNQRISKDFTYLDGDIRSITAYFPFDIIVFQDNETFVDCGAYDGDTINSFLNHLDISGSSYKSIYAFEPDAANFAKLEKLKETTPNFECINCGVWNEKTTLRFTDTNTMGSYVSEAGETIIETNTIDNVLNGAEATFIKMDIEGSELNALKGAAKTIKKYKPKLAICVYHKREDLLTIPEYIKSLNPSYKFYLRAHASFSTELVLYAV